MQCKDTVDLEAGELRVDTMEELERVKICQSHKGFMVDCYKLYKILMSAICQ